MTCRTAHPPFSQARAATLQTMQLGPDGGTNLPLFCCERRLLNRCYKPAGRASLRDLDTCPASSECQEACGPCSKARTDSPNKSCVAFGGRLQHKITRQHIGAAHRGCVLRCQLGCKSSKVLGIFRLCRCRVMDRGSTRTAQKPADLGAVEDRGPQVGLQGKLVPPLVIPPGLPHLLFALLDCGGPAQP